MSPDAKIPYVVGLIALDGIENVRLVGSIEDCAIEDVRIEMPVQAAFRLDSSGSPTLSFVRLDR